jgi:hypothetical protein
MTKEKNPANSANGEFEFQEPAGRNIVIFSDGTGQDGGVHPEQRLSNVYKLSHSGNGAMSECSANCIPLRLCIICLQA